MALASLLVKVFGLGAIVFLAQYILAYLRSPLKKLPGPFLAKFSNLWRFLNHYSQKQIETQKELHAKHGDAVAIGPNMVSISDPSLIRTIYSTRGTYIKSDFFSVNDALQNGRVYQNLFSTRSNELHAKWIKPVQKLYSFQAAQDLEPLMNDTVRVLCHELEHRFMEGENKGKTFDIADWFSYFTWDFMANMTFSRRWGFMEQAKDVDKILDNSEKATRYFSVIGQIPKLDKLLGKNPYLPVKLSDFSSAAAFSVDRFVERLQNMEQFKDTKDFMNGFLQAKQDYPHLVDDNEIIGYLIVNVLGGADTTGMVLKALMYHILKNPAVKSCLIQELHSASLTHPARYAALEALPYLDACIKEGLRIHPAVGHILERVVPPSGLTLSNGVTLPPGTIVGMNPWVVNRRRDIFGERVEEFVPERWLRGEGEGMQEWEVRVKRMRDADIGFGAGNRQCLGRPLALIELYKVTATLFAKYEIELEDPSKEWELNKQWFVWPHKIMVKMALS